MQSAQVTRAPSALGVTVAICTRDRTRSLERAIAAILPAIREHDELLVVLNAPKLESLTIDRSRYPMVRFVVEPRPGLSWSRNRALLEARSQVVLFTDDDCVPDARWINAYRTLFERNPDVDLATGLIEPLAISTPAQALFERYRGFGGSLDRRWIIVPRRPVVAHAVGNVGELGAGANFALRRRLVDRIGPFDAALGAGTETHGGDDLEFFFRALKCGALLAREPRAIVRHEHRLTMPELSAQLEGWSSGMACAMVRSGLAFPEEQRAYRLLHARIMMLHHARRAVFSADFRQLAVAELRGMRGAFRRYASARTQAEEIARSIPSIALDAPPQLRQPAAATTGADARGRKDQRAIELTELSQALEFEEDVVSASIAVTLHGRPLGTCEIPVLHRRLGVDRLVDAVMDHFGSVVVECEWNGAVQAARRQLGGLLRTAARLA